MPAPFYNAIKGTTAGTPGTGAFTPNAAAAGFRAWSNVPTNWIGMVRYDDGSNWELTWSFWNGTTLSRASTQMFDSSSGSQISLTSSATASMIGDAQEVMPNLGSTGWYGSWTSRVAAGPSGVGGTATATGTSAQGAIASTNFLTKQSRNQLTSATTANAQAGWSYASAQAFVDSTAGCGGWEFRSIWGASQLPTGPRLFSGMTSTTYVGSTSEPSAVTANYAAFAKDSTDTNIQLLVNSNAGAGTKTDTGIPIVANGWYETRLWMEPGSTTVAGLLLRVDTGAIWYGTTSTDTPVSGSALMPQCLGCLNGSNTGTAIIMNLSTLFCKIGV